MKHILVATKTRGLPSATIGTMIATADYELATTATALVDRSDRGQLLLRGAGAAEFLQGQVTNDVEALAPGEGCYAAMLDHKGKFRTDMRILRGEDWLLLDTEPIGLVPARFTVERYSVGREVVMEDVTETRSILSLVGPAARGTLDASPPAEEHAFVEGAHGLYVATDLGVDVITGDPAAAREALGVPEVPVEVSECLRIESGRPRLGYDMDAQAMPQEAGVHTRAVSFEKGCYVGQETVARLYWKGKPNRHLRGLRPEEPIERRAEVRLGERVVGRVGSACDSPRLGPVGLAILRREAEPGATVEVGDTGIPATVTELPF